MKKDRWNIYVRFGWFRFDQTFRSEWIADTVGEFFLKWFEYRLLYGKWIPPWFGDRTYDCVNLMRIPAQTTR